MSLPPNISMAVEQLQFQSFQLASLETSDICIGEHTHKETRKYNVSSCFRFETAARLEAILSYLGPRTNPTTMAF